MFIIFQLYLNTGLNRLCICVIPMRICKFLMQFVHNISKANFMEQSFHKKLIVTQLAKKLPTFYGSRRFINV
jgi:hypothetical protein